MACFSVILENLRFCTKVLFEFFDYVSIINCMVNVYLKKSKGLFGWEVVYGLVLKKDEVYILIVVMEEY